MEIKSKSTLSTKVIWFCGSIHTSSVALTAIASEMLSVLDWDKTAPNTSANTPARNDPHRLNRRRLSCGQSAARPRTAEKSTLGLDCIFNLYHALLRATLACPALLVCCERDVEIPAPAAMPSRLVIR